MIKIKGKKDKTVAYITVNYFKLKTCSSYFIKYKIHIYLVVAKYASGFLTNKTTLKTFKILKKKTNNYTK